MDDEDLGNEIVLPAAIQAAINQKATSFKPSRSGRTPAQNRAKMMYDSALRLSDVYHGCEDISEDNAESMVIKCLGRQYRDLSVLKDHYNKLAQVKIASQRDIQAAKFETQERANNQIVEMVNNMQSNMQQLFTKIDQLNVATVAAITHDTKPNGEDRSQPTG